MTSKLSGVIVWISRISRNFSASVTAIFRSTSLINGISNQANTHQLKFRTFLSLFHSLAPITKFYRKHVVQQILRNYLLVVKLFCSYLVKFWLLRMHRLLSFRQTKSSRFFHSPDCFFLCTQQQSKSGVKLRKIDFKNSRNSKQELPTSASRIFLNLSKNISSRIAIQFSEKSI